jgi:pimeloyl-ACP methyl ester carboxylesterase
MGLAGMPRTEDCNGQPSRPATELSPLTYRVMAAREGGNVPFKLYWKAIRTLRDHLDTQRITICGLSKGARAALMFAVHHPDRVDRIVVINAFVHLNSADRQARLDLYDLLLEPDGGRAWADRLLHLSYGAIVRGFLRSLETIDPVHIHAIFRELLAFDQRIELPDVACPVLLVRGDRDSFVPAYCVEELARRLAYPQSFGCRIVVTCPILRPLRVSTRCWPVFWRSRLRTAEGAQHRPLLTTAQKIRQMDNAAAANTTSRHLYDGSQISPRHAHESNLQQAVMPVRWRLRPRPSLPTRLRQW